LTNYSLAQFIIHQRAYAYLIGRKDIMGRDCREVSLIYISIYQQLVKTLKELQVNKHSSSGPGYALAIIGVVGGALLIPSLPVFFSLISLLLLLAPILGLALVLVGSWKEHKRG
jgi:hypothetical protein